MTVHLTRVSAEGLFVDQQLILSLREVGIWTTKQTFFYYTQECLRILVFIMYVKGPSDTYKTIPLDSLYWYNCVHLPGKHWLGMLESRNVSVFKWSPANPAAVQCPLWTNDGATFSSAHGCFTNYQMFWNFNNYMWFLINNNGRNGI